MRIHILIMETRSRRKRGGAGERAGPHRSRQDSQPTARGDDTGGAPLQVDQTTQEAEEEPNNTITPPTGEGVADNLTAQPTDPDNMQEGQRIKWSSEMNEELYRSYLRITELEVSSRPYGEELYNEMVVKYPVLRVKKIQNIIDQKRTIITKNRIPDERIQQIRREVARELGIDNEEEQDIAPATQSPEINTEETNIEKCYHKNWRLYEGMDPTKRPKLPRLQQKRGTIGLVKETDKIIERMRGDCENITDVQQMLYVGAATVLEMNQQEIRGGEQKAERKVIKRPWEMRLEKSIETYRKEMGVLTQFLKTNIPSNRVKNKAGYIVNKYKNLENINERDVLDLVRQKLAAKVNRLRRYKQSHKRRMHNKLFENSQKTFYRNLEEGELNQAQERIASDEGVLEFWANLWEEQKTHRGNAKWIKDEMRAVDKIPNMLNSEMSVEDIKEVIKKLQNWKAPGVDGLQNYWIKRFPALHPTIAKVFNKILKEPDNTPHFFTRGMTYLLPKTNAPDPSPDQFRPITCLTTLYKLFTAVLCNKIYAHVETHRLMPIEQKGCQRNSFGCKEQITIDTLITEHAKKVNGKLYWGYVDYRKAFDSVPHSWLQKVLELYKVAPQIRHALTTIMSKWETTLFLNNKALGCIRINRGIFQGDSLSPLWFCLALRPLSTMLNKRNYGYQVANNQKINHLVYMDDLKLIGQSTDELKYMLQQVKIFSADINMTFGLEKCKINGMERGKWKPVGDYVLEEKEHLQEQRKVIQSMEKTDNYKYLGVLQATGIEHKKIKDTLINKYKNRLRQILRTNLKAKHITTAINTYAIPVISYSFGLLKWTNTDLDSINRLTRKKLTEHRSHHPHGCLQRLYLPRTNGGRGLLDIKRLHSKISNGMREYFYKNMDESPLLAAIVKKDKNYTPLNLENRNAQIGGGSTVPELIEAWARKELHGRHLNSIQQEHIDFNASNMWLQNGDLFPETEGFVLSIQDHVIATLNYRRYIIKDPNVKDDKCRVCKTRPETIEHITNACPVMAAKEYTERHNAVARILHSWLALKIGYAQERVPYYKYKPQNVCETPSAILYWDRTVQTDHTVINNRPDIVLLNKTTNQCTIIDIAIPSPANIVEKYKEKVAKYLPLAAEIRQVWNVENTRIVPIIIGATGEIPKSLLTNLELLDVPKAIYIEMQKAVLLSTANIVRQTLNLHSPATGR